MTFIPHTQEDIKNMLEKIGIQKIDELFADIPQSIFRPNFERDLPSLDEMTLSQHMYNRAAQNEVGEHFLGAGAYRHYIPPTVWALASRGEFMTAYTPYQAEASQGSLQLFWEYQSMMASLMQMDVSNASMYDGATSVFEAIMMLLRTRRVDCAQAVVYIPESLHPHYRQVLQTLTAPHGVQCVAVPFDEHTGRTSLSELQKVWRSAKASCLVLPQPNFLGQLEKADELTDWCHSNDCEVIGVVNPIACALIKPPGEWGEKGADVACGEGQPLGVPLSSGGPYFGFFCCKEKYLRQLPGRVVGKTVDKQGKECFTLTLQAREQHIRRARATSNICTNQGLFVIAATIYMSLIGPQGLSKVATMSHQRMKQLSRALERCGVKPRFEGEYFHERVFDISDAEVFLDQCEQERFIPGFKLSTYYKQLPNSILACATELTTDEGIRRYASLLQTEGVLA